MANVWMENESNYLLLTEGYAPSAKELQSAAPQIPSCLRMKSTEFKTPEETFAHVINALARRMAYFRRCEFGGSLKTLMQVPLDTVVFSAPPSSKATFADWFAGEPTNYRIFIHRSPLKHAGHPVPEVWRSVYRGLETGSRRVLHLKHKNISHALKQAAKPFLENLLHAYSDGDHAVQTLLEQSGHPYFFVRGTRYSNSLCLGSSESRIQQKDQPSRGTG